MPDRRPAEFAADLPDRAFYRILDANANRAGEGLRTLEEWARFVQNDVGLTTALKQLRHDLTMTLERLPRHQLLASRDTPGDVHERPYLVIVQGMSQHALIAVAQPLFKHLIATEGVGPIWQYPVFVEW